MIVGNVKCILLAFIVLKIDSQGPAHLKMFLKNNVTKKAQ